MKKILFSLILLVACNSKPSKKTIEKDLIKVINEKYGYGLKSVTLVELEYGGYFGTAKSDNGNEYSVSVVLDKDGESFMYFCFPQNSTDLLNMTNNEEKNKMQNEKAIFDLKLVAIKEVNYSDGKGLKISFEINNTSRYYISSMHLSVSLKDKNGDYLAEDNPEIDFSEVKSSGSSLAEANWFVPVPMDKINSILISGGLTVLQNERSEIVNVNIDFNMLPNKFGINVIN